MSCCCRVRVPHDAGQQGAYDTDFDASKQGAYDTDFQGKGAYDNDFTDGYLARGNRFLKWRHVLS